MPVAGHGDVVRRDELANPAGRKQTTVGRIPIEIRTVPATSPDALRLAGAMLAEITEIYGKAKGPGPSATPQDFSPPGGAFVVVYEGETAVGGGGIKRLDAQTAEIKRMYVVPQARGRGLAKILLTGLEDAARDLGYTRVRLDTGEHQHVALRLYPSAGYTEIPDYNNNPYACYWAEKVLAP